MIKMAMDQRSRFMLLLAALATLVAGADAALNRAWDLVVVLGPVLVVLTVMLVARPARPTVTVRSDLARWLDERCAATGEPVEQLTDRCIAAYRAGLTGPVTASEHRSEARSGASVQPAQVARPAESTLVDAGHR